MKRNGIQGEDKMKGKIVLAYQECEKRELGYWEKYANGKYLRQKTNEYFVRDQQMINQAVGISLLKKPKDFKTELSYIKYYPHILLTLFGDTLLSYALFRLCKYVYNMNRIDEIEI